MSASRLLIAAVLFGALFAPSAAGAKSAKEIFAEAAGGVIVVITESASGEQIGQGSGVVVGVHYAATNCHVVENAAKIIARQAAGERGRETYKMEAEIIARDDERDLCLLYIPDLSKPPAAPPVEMGNAKALSVGEEVFAIGAPQGFELSLSRGIVSQLRGDYGKDAAPYIQTDAAISPGSSGGGLFNEEGELVGITTFKYTGGGAEGLSFAIPVEWVGELRERVALEIAAKEKCLAEPNFDCLIAESLRLANDIADANWRAYALKDIAAAQAEAGNKAAAQATFTAALQAGNDNIDAFKRATALRHIAKTQAEVGDVVAAMETANSINEASSRSWALGAIAEAHAEANDIAAAIQTTNNIGDASIRAHALVAIAGAQAKAGDFAAAMETANSINEASSRSWALGAIAEAHAEANDIAAAIQTTNNIADAPYRANALGAIAGAQAKAGDFAAAMRTANDIANPFAQDFALRNIAEAQTEAGDLAAAMETVNSINEASSRHRGLRDIAKAQAEANDIAAAIQTANNIAYASIRATALAAIAEAQAKMGDKAAAHEIFAVAVRTANDSADAFWRTSALRDIAKAQAEVGDFRAAVQTAIKIASPYNRASTIATIAVALVRQKDGKNR